MKKLLVLLLLFSFCNGNNESIDEISTIESSTTTLTTLLIQDLIADNSNIKQLFQPGDFPFTNFAPFVFGPDCFITEPTTYRTMSFFDPNEVTFVLSENNMLLVSFKVLNSYMPDGKSQLNTLLDTNNEIGSLKDYVDTVGIDFFRVKIKYSNHLFDKSFNPYNILFIDGDSNTANDFDYLKIPILKSSSDGSIEFYVYFIDGSYLKSESKLIISEKSKEICVENNKVDINGNYKANDNLVPIRVFKTDLSSWNKRLNSINNVSLQNQTDSYKTFEDNVKAFEEIAFSDSTNNQINEEEFSNKLIYISSSNDLDKSNLSTSQYESFFDIQIENENLNVGSVIENSSGISVTGGPDEWVGTFDNLSLSLKRESTGVDYIGLLDNNYFEFHCTDNGGALIGYGAPEDVQNIAFSICR